MKIIRVSSLVYVCRSRDLQMGSAMDESDDVGVYSIQIGFVLLPPLIHLCTSFLSTIKKNLNEHSFIKKTLSLFYFISCPRSSRVKQQKIHTISQLKFKFRESYYFFSFFFVANGKKKKIKNK